MGGVEVVELEWQTINTAVVGKEVCNVIEFIGAMTLGPREVQGAFMGVEKEQKVLEHG